VTQGLQQEWGSFRDPAGQVFELGDRILRTVTDYGAQEYERLRSSDLLARLMGDGRLVQSKEIGKETLNWDGVEPRYLLEHPRLPFISYPYEWSFSLLRAAAQFHLELQLDAFAQGFVLSDASAYNIQFDGPKPIFIDHLSFRSYREGEFWTGHRQFCEQFLNPLLLRACLGIPHNAWYRGTQEGITAGELSRLLKWHQKMSWRVLTHVVMQGRFQQAAMTQDSKEVSSLKQKKLPATAYRGMLEQLLRWVSCMTPADKEKSTWADYTQDNNYDQVAEQTKRDFVSKFCTEQQPQTLWDLGCNTGAYSELALSSGTSRVIGFDFDQGALEAAYERAKARDLKLTPLFLDATNPSPDQGWNGKERKGFHSRSSANSILALAFLHHLAIGRNIPLAQAVDWLVDLAPSGVIEFVDKKDSQVGRMLSLRDDIFPDYCREAFLAHLGTRARIVATQDVPPGNRLLVSYRRT